MLSLVHTSLAPHTAAESSVEQQGFGSRVFAASRGSTSLQKAAGSSWAGRYFPAAPS